MANEVYILPQTGITWGDTGETNAMTLNNLATGAGRQGAQHDFGASARANRYEWRAHVEFATTPVVGEEVRIYLKTSDGTHPDNDDGTGDIAVSAEDKLRNIRLLGIIQVDQAATSVEMVASGDITINTRYVMPIFWNGTADNLTATNNTSGFSLTPFPYQIQSQAMQNFRPDIDVEINPNHPLAKDLVFAAVPGGKSRKDLVSGNYPAVIETSGEFYTPSQIGAARNSTSTTAGGMSWPLTETIKQITDELTMLVWAEIDSPANWAALLGMAYRLDGTWADPFYSLGFIRNSGNTTANFAKTVAGTDTNVTSDTAFFDFDGSLNLYGVAVKGSGAGSVIWYKNGEAFGATDSTSSGNVDFGTNTEISIMQRSTNPTGEGYDGRCPGAFLWKRQLSANEIKSFYSNPWDIFLPVFEPEIFAVLASGVTGTMATDFTVDISEDMSGNVIGFIGQMATDFTVDISESMTGAVEVFGDLAEDFTVDITESMVGTFDQNVSGTMVTDFTDQISEAMSGTFSQPVTGIMATDFTDQITESMVGSVTSVDTTGTGVRLGKFTFGKKPGTGAVGGSGGQGSTFNQDNIMSGKLLIAQGGSVPFQFDRGGESIDGWVCTIQVKIYHTDSPLIERVVVPTGNYWTGYLTSAETEGLSAGNYRIIGKLTNSSSVEAQEVANGNVRFKVNNPWFT